MRELGRRPKRPLVAAMLLASPSSLLLASLLFNGGTTYSWKDPYLYFRSAVRLVETGDLSYGEYQVRDDRLSTSPLAHFPSLTSATLALGITLGIPPHQAPSVVNFLAWILLLFAAVLLTRALTTRPSAPAFTVAWLSITSPVIEPYTTLMSEPLFLALLTLFVWQLTQRAQEDEVSIPALLGVATLGGLLTLSRYVAVFFVLGGLIWWSAVRWKGRTFRALRTEASLLSLGLLPLFLWSLRNVARTEHTLGEVHFKESAFSFTDGILALVEQSAWIVLPLVRPGPILRELGAPLFVSGAILGLAVVAGAFAARPRAALVLHQSPVAAFMLIYFAVFTFLQPFLAFYPMNRRFMSVALVLLGPWLVAGVSRLRSWACGTLLASFLSFNVLVLGLLMHRTGAGDLFRPGVPLIDDMGGRHEEVVHLLHAGIPSWLLHYPGRVGDLETHLPELRAYLGTLPEGIPIISNAPDLFPDHPLLRATHPVETWIELGACTPRVLVVLVDWDRWSGSGPALPYWNLTEPGKLLDRVREKCGSVEAIRFPNATAVWLSHTKSANRQELTTPRSAGGSAPPSQRSAVFGRPVRRARGWRPDESVQRHEQPHG